MDDKFRSSFIPKQPLGEHEGTSSRQSRSTSRSRGSGPLMTASITFLFMSLLAFGGIHLWDFLVKKRISEKDEKLKELEREIGSMDIDKYKNLDNRIKIAKERISNHRVTYPIFSVLNETTLPTVQYESFSFEVATPDPNAQATSSSSNYKITLRGLADTFETISLQSRLYKTNPNVRKATFHSFGLDEQTGLSSFEINLEVEPKLLSFTDSATRTNGFNFDQEMEGVDVEAAIDQGRQEDSEVEEERPSDEEVGEDGLEDQQSEE